MPLQQMPEVVTAQALADLLDVSTRHLRRLSEQEVVVRSPAGGYFFGASVRGYMESVAAEARRRAGGKADDDLRTTRRLALERKLEREDRGLVATAEAVEAVTTLANMFVVALEGVPDAIGRKDEKCTTAVANAVSGLLKRRDELTAKLEGGR